MKRVLLFLVALCFGLTIKAQVNLEDGLIAYYPFNGNANDESGLGANGVVTGAVLTADRFGNPDNAYSFIDDTISFENSLLPQGNSDRAFSVWFKINSLDFINTNSSVFGTIFNYGTFTTTQRFGILIYGSSSPDKGTPYFVGQYNDFPCNGYYFDNKWHHLIVNYTSGVVDVYIDGILNESQAKDLNTQGDTLKIGRTIYNEINQTEFFNGDIDDIRIYDRALNEQEVWAIYKTEIFNALDFDGIDDGISIPNDPTLHFGTGPHTLELWFKKDAMTTNGSLTILSNYYISPYTTISINGADQSIPGSITFVMRNNSNVVTSVTSSKSYDDNHWHHVAGVRDISANKIFLYIDGEMIGEAAGINGHCDSNNPFIICRHVYQSSLDITVDEIRIWNTARTEAEIKANMYDTINVNSTGLVAYYRCGQQNPTDFLPDLTVNNNNGTFVNMDPSVAWVESYAMVAPIPNEATDLTCDGFTASWVQPNVGIVDNYYLEIATDENFDNLVSGYNPYDNGTDSIKIVTGLATENTYYYRVRASKTSVGDVGAYHYSNPISVVLDDVTAPVTPTLADVTGECSATATAPTTTDNCAGTITGTTSDPTEYTAQGTYTITWTYDDNNGNSTTQTQNVVIDDVTAPVPDEATLVDITAECEVTTLTAPTATDNCAGTVTVTHDATLPINTQGTTVVTWTYDDGNGNTSTQTQNVIIDDVTNPTITCIGNQTVDADATHTYTVQGTQFDPTATDDNCGVASVINDFNSTSSLAGAQLPEDTTITIVWTVTDVAGNTDSCSFDVTVNDYVGIYDLSENGINLYPNPTSGKLIVNSEKFKIINLEITEINGRTIENHKLSTFNYQLSIEDYPNGIYFLKIETETSIFIEKIIKY